MANSINATSTGNGGIITTGDDSGVLNIQTNETTAISIDASQSVDFTNNIDAPNTFGFKNRIINGRMDIDQRNAGASVNPTDGQYTLDRWQASRSQASKFTFQQNAGSVTPPSGFTNYLGITSSSAYSVISSDYFLLGQNIEGFNIADFGWGTSSAATVTLSFWVRSSLTGTFGGALNNSGNVRSYPFTYTVNSANTWEQKSITIAGDTSGTWLTSNGIGVSVRWGLGVGSTLSGTAGSWATAPLFSATGATSVVGTNGATFYITGVQLEKGTQATSFDFRSYGTELALCQRYYWNLSAALSATIYSAMSTGTIDCATTSRAFCYYRNPVQMRSSPTFGYNGALSQYSAYVKGAIIGTPSSMTQDNVSPNVCDIYVDYGSAVFTAGSCGSLIANNNNTALISWSAEL